MRPGLQTRFFGANNNITPGFTFCNRNEFSSSPAPGFETELGSPYVPLYSVWPFSSLWGTTQFTPMMSAVWWDEGIPLPWTGAANWKRITGITKDANDAAIGGCTVHLFRTTDDVLIGITVSATDGTYEIGVVDENYSMLSRRVQGRQPRRGGYDKKQRAGVVGDGHGDGLYPRPRHHLVVVFRGGIRPRP